MTTAPKPFIFVLMPFSSDFDDIYHLGIKATCNEAGAYAERVDEQIFTENILERVYNQIAKADLIIADMTGRNPNVFYETGYAHAIGKTVILLTQNLEDIPFDLKLYPHIVYQKSITKLKTELFKKVSWAIDNLDLIGSMGHQPELTINGQPIIDNPILPFLSRTMDLSIAFYNPIHQTLKELSIRSLLITKEKVDAAHRLFIDNYMPCRITIDTNGNSVILLNDEQITISPGFYEITTVTIAVSQATNISSWTLRVSTNNQVFDYPFMTEFPKR